MITIREDIAERNKKLKEQWDTYKRKKRDMIFVVFMLLGSFFANAIFAGIYAVSGDVDLVNRHIYIIVIEVFAIILLCGLKDIIIKCPSPDDIIILQEIINLSNGEPRLWFNIGNSQSYIYAVFFNDELQSMDICSVPVVISDRVSDTENTIAYLTSDKKNIMVDLNKESYNDMKFKKNTSESLHNTKNMIK